MTTLETPLVEADDTEAHRAAQPVVPPLSPRGALIRAVLVMVCALSAGLVLQMVVVSRLQHHAAQGRAFNQFRGEVANGTAPLGPVDDQNRMIGLGSPVAYLVIPSIGVKEVVGEGTSSGVLFDGPGHRRDTPLPGQIGTSTIYGRRASYGGPFSDLDKLQKGDQITVTTGQGVFTYEVLGVRREGMPMPQPVAAGSSRLILVTADGTPFVPNGLVRVDADLKGQAVGGAGRVHNTESLPKEELAMKGDARTLWALALWLQALIALSLLAIWSWHRLGRAQTWIIFFPLVGLVGLAVAGEITRLLPNLL
jgi:LPXTG-site transpeptidase (sortase) family protein